MTANLADWLIAERKRRAAHQAAAARARWTVGDAYIYRTFVIDRRYANRPDRRCTVTSIGRTRGVATVEPEGGREFDRGIQVDFELATGLVTSRQTGTAIGRVMTDGDVADERLRDQTKLALRERHLMSSPQLPRYYSTETLVALLVNLDADRAAAGLD